MLMHSSSYFWLQCCLEYNKNTTHMEHQISILGTWNLDQTGPNFLVFNLYASAKHVTNCTCTQLRSDHSSVHTEVFCNVALKAVWSKLNFMWRDSFSWRSSVSNCTKTCAEVLECYVHPVGCEHIYRTKVVIHTFLNHHLLQFPLGSGSLHNLLINGCSCHKSIKNNRSSLANAVTTVLGLQINLWIL
jgi:hypothetical protein